MLYILSPENSNVMAWILCPLLPSLKSSYVSVSTSTSNQVKLPCSVCLCPGSLHGPKKSFTIARCTNNPIMNSYIVTMFLELNR